MRLRLLVSFAALVATTAPGAGAQVIRGVVTEAGSGAPLAGVLVSLRAPATASDTGAVLRGVLTSGRGEYAVTLPGPGLYRLTVRRIGVRAWTSDLIRASAGETITQAVVLDAFTSLPRITVADRSLCTTGPNALRVAELWNEAQVALTMIGISNPDSILGRRLVRFTRKEKVYGSEVLEESYHSYDEKDGIGEPNFRSLPADSLSLGGYWRETGNDMSFFAPDATALLSAAFVRDHCFSLAQRRDHAGLAGLAFVPARGRLTPDIRGTIWLDSTSYELRRVEFTWTQLPRELQHDRVGGDVEFLRLPTGQWIVKHWTLTMPRPAMVEFRSTGGNTTRLMIDGINVEGGMILINGLAASDQPGTVTGRITRNGRPLTGARVRLVGTPFVADVDGNGSFRFDSVPPGVHSLVAEHPEYDAFGVRLAEQEFALQEGATRHFALMARSEKEIADAMCPGRDFRLPTLRLTLLDETTGRGLANTRLRMRWLEVVTAARGKLLGQEARDTDLNVITNERGLAVFCSLPAARTLTLGYPVDSGLYPLHTFRLGTQENAIATVRASPP